MRKTRRFELGPLKDELTEDFAASAASEDDVADAIRRLRAECGYLVDPHTACGLVAAERALGSGDGDPAGRPCRPHTPRSSPMRSQAITGERPALPERLADLLTRS